MRPNFVSLWHKSAAFRVCVAVVAVGLTTVYFHDGPPTAQSPAPTNTSAAAAAADPQAATTPDPSSGVTTDPAVDPIQAGADVANDVLDTFDRSLRKARQ